MTESQCRWCGETYEQHTESRGQSEPVPRMPCLGLRRNFAAREEKIPVRLADGSVVEITGTTIDIAGGTMTTHMRVSGPLAERLNRYDADPTEPEQD